MCTTCSQDVVVGAGGSVVVLVVLVVLVVVDVVDVEVDDDVVEVVAMLVDGGGTSVVAGRIDEEDEATLVGAAPSADWIRSLHAANADSVRSASTTPLERFIPRSRPTGRRHAETLPLDRAPSTHRDGR
jgi:hypothetical protein